MASGAYPVQLLHLPGGGGQWCNLGAAYAAVTFLRPQRQSLVLYAAGPDGQPQRIVFVYPILPGDAFERLDGATLSWAEPESGNGIADTLAGLRVAREDGAPAPGGGDIAARLAQLSIGRP